MIGRVTWVDYIETDEYGILVRLSARLADGTKFNGYIKGTEPYIFVPEDERVPNRDYIQYTEEGYESLFDLPLQKVVTDTPKQEGNLTDRYTWTGEGDVPYYRRVAIQDGFSGYIDIPETEEEYEGLPLVDAEDIEAEPEFDSVIDPRISIADIEVHVPEDRSFDKMQENASEPINVICSYDTYEEKYTVFFYDKYGGLDASDIRLKMADQLAGTDIQEYTNQSIELVTADTEIDMLNEYIEYVENKEFDLVSGWNYVDFDHEYIVDRMKNLYDEDEPLVHPAWLSPFGEEQNAKMEQMRIPGLPSFDMMEGFCFSGDTDVLTPTGVKNIKELEIGDEVYTLNEDTHNVEVKPVEDTHRTKNKWGTLESHSGRSHDFKVTPNHRFYLPKNPRKSRGELSEDDYIYEEYQNLSEKHTPYKFPEHNEMCGKRKETFDLGKEASVTLASISEKNGMWLRKRLDEEDNTKVDLTHGTSERFGYENRVGKYKIPSEVYVENQEVIEEYSDELFIKAGTRTTAIPNEYHMDDWLELMGWYISEGYVSSRSDSLHICQINRSQRRLIRDLLERMNLPYTTNDEEFQISSQTLGVWFRENCGDSSYDKEIPEWVFDLDYSHLDNLLWSLVEGDGSGSLTEDTAVCYSTVSKNLKEDVLKLALQCGYKPSVRRHSEHNHIYQIDISEQGGSFVKSEGESIEHHDTVYCITAKDNHTIMAGRNGSFSWIGQCDKLTRGNWRSQGLEYVSNEELGIGKINDVDINDDWKNNPSRLIAYNIVDVILTVALDDFNDIHGFFYEMADVCSIPIYDVFYEKRQVDGYVMSSRGDDEILPTTDKAEDIDNAGGFVADPANGRIPNVGVSDLKSLYPSAMITWNISTETVSDSPDEFDRYVKIPKVPEPKEVHGEIKEDQIEFDWLYASLDKQGIIPRTLKKLFSKRNREKKRMYEAEPGSAEYKKWDKKQGSTKVLMNSFYGVSSSVYWRLSNQYLGDAVTSAARYTLWKGKHTLKRLDYEHVYSDTDSHFLQLTKNTPEDRVEELKMVSAEMDADASEILIDCGFDDEHPFLVDSDLHGDEYTCMMWEAEKTIENFMQLGKKKRYAMNLEWKEGTYYEGPKISISGYENQRSDSMPKTAELQEEIIEMVLTGAEFGEVSEYLQDVIDEIDENSSDVEKFALPGSINKDLEDYPNRQVPRASMWSNEHLEKSFGEGDDPFVYLVEDTPPAYPQTDVVALEWNDGIPDGFKLDKEAIIERGIKKPIEVIVREMGWEFRELRSGKQQKEMEFGSGNPFE